MKFNFIKINPTENMTVYVLDKVERKNHAEIANKIMQYGNLYAEQVGFLEECEDISSTAQARLQMMGGEFCGNASRGFAAMLVDQNLIAEQEDVFIEASGSKQILRCKVQKLAEKSYYVSMQLPNIIAVDKIKIVKNNIELKGILINFGGISHWVLVTEDINRDEKYIKELLSLLPYKDYDAFGVIQYNDKTGQMLPAVYVKQTDSLFLERSCGSGTAAVGVAMSVIKQKSQDLDVKQDGGTLKITTEYQNDKVEKIILGGQIDIVAKGEVYI